MPREAIRLDPLKVKHHIERAGFPLKQLLDGMHPKTIQRIKAGKNTTMATAMKLATKLKVTVDDLIKPITAGDMKGFLPEQWLYDEAPAPSAIKYYSPFLVAIGGHGYHVGRSPIDIDSPFEQLLKWWPHRRKKIVLRKENRAFVLEVHNFDYSSGQERRIVYQSATACRFFPLARDGDTFTKTGLRDLLTDYVWKKLKQEALANAELVSIEGYEYPVHPDAYFPLVRFYQGSVLKRTALGARFFEQLETDFKSSLIDYLDGIGTRPVRAKTTPSGIAVTVEPVRPVFYTPEWREEQLEMEVDLVWRTPDGKLALAPWRLAHRNEFAEAISSRQWNRCHSRGMPIPYFPENGEDDPETPPFEPDRSLSADTIADINALDHPDPFEFFWEN